MTTVFVVFLLCCAGTSHFIRGRAVRILFGIFPRIAPFVKKFHSMRKFYKEGQGGRLQAPLAPPCKTKNVIFFQKSVVFLIFKIEKNVTNFEKNNFFWIGFTRRGKGGLFSRPPCPSL